MLHTRQAIEDFQQLSHQNKLGKVKEVLKLAKSKAPVFTELYNYFGNKEDIDDNILEFLYNFMMNIIYNKQTLEISNETKIALAQLRNK